MALFRPVYIDKKTGKRKQSGVWWYEFAFAGKRYRESTKATRKTVAAEREKRRKLELERHYAGGARPESPLKMLRTVSDAVDEYSTRYDAPNHRAKSIAWVKERIPHLKRLLGPLTLLDVTEAR